MKSAMACKLEKKIGASVKLDGRRDKLDTLVMERRELEAKPTDQQLRRDVSKAIQKEMKKSSREAKRAKISERLAEFKGLRTLADIRSSGRRSLLRSVVDRSIACRVAIRGS